MLSHPPSSAWARARNFSPLLIARSALFRAADNKWQVFVVRDGLATLQSVKVGLMNDEQVEITEGILEGEPVILAPESSLTDDTRVKIVNGS